MNAPQHNQFKLLRTRRFFPFFVAQSLGALNDNVFKNALVLLLTFHAASWTTLDITTLSNLAGALFILPFLLFSATAGQLADKFDKTRITRYVKLFEIGIMVLAAIGFYQHSFTLLMVALFLMGTHSTLFGPVKYAILPQHLKPQELIGGNALVETGTSLAILFGTVIGGLLVAGDAASPSRVVIVTLAIGLAGYAASRSMPAAPPADAGLKINWNPLSETLKNLASAYRTRSVFLALLGISWFWFYGFLFLSQFPAFTKDVLGGDEHVITLLLTVFSIGIAAGSLLCEKLSGPRIEVGLVPFGAIGLTLFAIDLYFASPSSVAGHGVGVTGFWAMEGSLRILLDLFLIGAFGGFYIVPLYALVQSRSEAANRSRVIAANNILNALFMVVAAGLAVGLSKLGVGVAGLFLTAGLINALVAILLFRWVPEFFLRFLAWLLVHSVYRIRKADLHHIPESGPALLVCNHVSYADALILMAACPRPVRFVMEYEIYRLPVVKQLCRAAGVIPIAPGRQQIEVLKRAFEDIHKALAAGEVVAIFPEGRITHTGDILPFRNGLKRILSTAPVPVVPLALRGLWGSFFSRKHGRAMSRPFVRGCFSEIEVLAGEPMRIDEAAPENLRALVVALRGDEK